MCHNSATVFLSLTFLSMGTLLSRTFSLITNTPIKAVLILEGQPHQQQPNQTKRTPFTSTRSCLLRVFFIQSAPLPFKIHSPDNKSNSHPLSGALVPFWYSGNSLSASLANTASQCSFLLSFPKSGRNFRFTTPPSQTGD